MLFFPPLSAALRASGLALLVIGAALAAAPARAQLGTAQGDAFRLLGLSPTARSAAMAGAVSARADGGLDAGLYSPALLSERHEGLATVSYFNHVAGIWAGYAAYAREMPRFGGTAAAHLRYLSYGELDGRDEIGQETGAFSAGEVALTLSYAREINERFRAGGNAHAVFATIDDAGASAVALDAGVAYLVPELLLTVTGSVHHAGLTLSRYADAETPLPFDVRLAVSKRLARVPLTLSVTGYDLTQFDGGGSAGRQALRHVVLGGELQLGALALRGGLNPRLRDDLGTSGRLDFSGAGLGVGLQLSRIGVDYAYNGWSQFGGLHHFTVQARLR